MHNCANKLFEQRLRPPIAFAFFLLQSVQEMDQLKLSLNCDKKQDEHPCQYDNKIFPLLD